MTSTEAQPKFQVMPQLSDEEYAALEQSIAENGVLQPILVDEDGEIIEGHHRKEIADKLGKDCPKKVVAGKTDQQKIAMALTLNIDRRHLDREQRRELLAKSIKAQPELSDRQHAERVKTDHKTAGKVRAELEERGEIPHTETRFDTTGRKQTPRKSISAKTATPKPSATKTDSARELLKMIRRAAELLRSFYGYDDYRQGSAYDIEIDAAIADLLKVTKPDTKPAGM